MITTASIAEHFSGRVRIAHLKLQPLNGFICTKIYCSIIKFSYLEFPEFNMQIDFQKLRRPE
ncbi:MAG: hypothetical protein QX196_01825 [Methylococcaceae bacterium]